jgi:hypothetical protein
MTVLDQQQAVGMMHDRLRPRAAGIVETVNQGGAVCANVRHGDRLDPEPPELARKSRAVTAS